MKWFEHQADAGLNKKKNGPVQVSSLDPILNTQPRFL